MERCEGCGFAWDLISATDVPERLRSAAAAYRTAFAAQALHETEHHLADIEALIARAA